MKVLANGGLNLSELDGWWADAYSADVGWASVTAEIAGRSGWDAAEANALYTLLEEEIIPTFMTAISAASRLGGWRESMARLTPAFSANRMVRQYAEEHCIPLASAYCGRSADAGRKGADLLAWQRGISSRWHDVRFGPVAIDSREGKYFFSVLVHLGSVEPDDIRVELYADSVNAGRPFCCSMARDHAVPGEPQTYRYSCAAPNHRPAHHYTPRAIPNREGVLIPLELRLITWQK